MFKTKALLPRNTRTYTEKHQKNLLVRAKQRSKRWLLGCPLTLKSFYTGLISIFSGLGVIRGDKMFKTKALLPRNTRTYTEKE